jgi:putative membrane fusion protein
MGLDRASGQVNTEKTGDRRKRLERAGLIKQARIWLVRALLVAVALLVLVWLGKQAYDFGVSKAIRTESAQWSALSSSYDGQAIIMQNETVVTAPAAGRVAWLVPEGVRVHIGSEVARISGAVTPGQAQESVAVTSPVAGAVSYRPDGWEGILTPDNYKRMDLFTLFDTVRKNHQNNPPQDVQSGDPVYKVIDNLVNPYLVVRLDKKPGDLAISSRVNLTWGEAGTGKGKIIGFLSRSGTYVAVVEVSQSSEGIFTGRMLDVTMISKKGEGYVLPSQALVEKDGKQGVYLKTPVGIKFVKVEVIATLDDRVVVQGIQAGADVVVNPGLASKLEREI